MQFEIKLKNGRSAKLSQLLIHWLVNSLGLLIVSKAIKGIEFHGEGLGAVISVLAAGAVLGLVNVAIKPLLLILTLPINILSLGLFTLVVNAACMGLVSYVVDGFAVSGFWAACWGALLFSLISMLLNGIMLVGGFKVKINR